MDRTIFSESSTFPELLDTFHVSIKLEKKHAAEKMLREIEEQRKSIHDPNLLIKSALMEIRFSLLAGETERAETMFADFENAKKELNDENAFYYHCFKGHLFYEKGHLQHAIIAYEKAAEYLEELSNTAEKPDFYYKLANAYYHAYITSLSVINATLAIQEAQEQKQDYVLAKSKLLQGLNYLEWKDYEGAEALLHEALSYRQQDTGSEFNLVYMINHNLGLVYLRKGLPDTAVHYFKRAIEDQESSHYMKSLYYLAEALFYAGRNEEALRYFDIGFSISKRENNELYKWIFAMLHKKFIDRSSFEGVWQQGIEYFITKNDKFNVKYYSERFAEYFFKKGEHVKASYYYRLAIK
ncbi:tetratricopeptide repeat protein [Terribacillus sp. FSL K6-0262]|uniref:tetratricopeptide repeat protein n=1 Tax=Terribacillus TaxID=459532 RepID=UPI0030ED60B6